MKIFSIVGTRPHFMKIDPDLEQEIIHTGQHYNYDMSRIFFKGLSLKTPLYHLRCRTLGHMIDKLTPLLKTEKPALVIVYGDTNSSLAGAISAKEAKIKLVHVEAGLRSYEQIPEERNRVLIDHISDILFCPNNFAELNLAREGIKKNVFVVGDSLFDAMGRFLPFERKRNYGKYNVLTIHRDFNADNIENLKNIFTGLEGDFPIVFPCHPRTLKTIKENKIQLPKNISLKKPKDYKSMLTLISNCLKVITDSGGVQREAFWMQKSVIILRDITEWEEIIAKGGGVLVGTDKDRIRDAVQNFHGRIVPPPIFGTNEKIRQIIYRFI